MPCWRSACSKDPEFAKQEYLKSGDRFAAEKKYREAVVQYRNAIQQDARFGEARLKLADAYEKLKDGQNALREYVRAADLLPDNVDAQVKAASLLLAARQFEDAKTRAEKALAKDPRRADAQIILGNALAGLNNLPEAIKELEEAVQLDPSLRVSAHLAGRGRSRQRPAAPRPRPRFGRQWRPTPRSPIAHMSLANFLMSTSRAGRGRGLAEASGRARTGQHPREPLAGRRTTSLAGDLRKPSPTSSRWPMQT